MRVVEQALVVLLQVISSIVSADAEHNGPKLLQIAALNVVSREDRDIKPDLAEDRRDVVASAHDVSHPETRRDLRIHDCGALDCGLEIEKSANIRTRNKVITLTELATVACNYCLDAVTPFSSAVGQHFELDGTFAAGCEIDDRGLRFHSPAFRCVGADGTRSMIRGGTQHRR